MTLVKRREAGDLSYKDQMGCLMKRNVNNLSYKDQMQCLMKRSEAGDPSEEERGR